MRSGCGGCTSRRSIATTVRSGPSFRNVVRFKFLTDTSLSNRPVLPRTAINNPSMTHDEQVVSFCVSPRPGICSRSLDVLSPRFSNSTLYQAEFDPGQPYVRLNQESRTTTHHPSAHRLGCSPGHGLLVDSSLCISMDMSSGEEDISHRDEWCVHLSQPSSQFILSPVFSPSLPPLHPIYIDNRISISIKANPLSIYSMIGS